MLRMSKLTDYGTVVMTYLAREPGRLHAASEIAAHIHVAVPTVSKILKTLVREGLVVSHRGVKGGHTLARSAQDISMAEVIDAMEGPIALTECSSAEGICVQETSCSIRDSWQKINVVIREALSGVTLAEMVEPASQHVVRFQPRKPPLRESTH